MARKLTQTEQEQNAFTPLRHKEEVSRWERFTDFWSEFRWLVILGIAVLLIVVYLVVSFTSTVPDLTLCVVTTGTAAEEDLEDRLTEILTPYAMDINGNGRVLLKIETYTIGSEAFEQEIAGGKKFILLSSPEATQYLAEHKLTEPMTTFSAILPADIIGPKIEQLYPFSREIALHDDIKDWTISVRSYSAEGYDKAKETKYEVISAIHFYAYLLNEWVDEIPGTVSK